MAYKELTILVSYSQIAVFDHSLVRPFNEWTERHVLQGFSWRHGTVSFRTIEEVGRHLVAITLNAGEAELAADAVRVIDVPFEVPLSGEIEVGSISDSVSVEIPPGQYQLRFECYALVSGSVPKIRLSFGKNDNPHFSVVRADLEINRGTDFLLTAAPG